MRRQLSRNGPSTQIERYSGLNTVIPTDFVPLCHHVWILGPVTVSDAKQVSLLKAEQELPMTSSHVLNIALL